MRCVALLRGVNVGGVRFVMADLAAGLEEAGFGAVRTVLASGNVVLDGPGPAAAADGVHRVVRERFGFDVAVVAVPAGVVAGAVEGFPFDRREGRHAYTVFATAPEALDELAADAAGLDADDERVVPGPGVLYWDVEQGRTLSSAFGRRLAKRVREGAVTTRNLRTLERILQAV